MKLRNNRMTEAKCRPKAFKDYNKRNLGAARIGRENGAMRGDIGAINAPSVGEEGIVLEHYLEDSKSRNIRWRDVYTQRVWHRN